jgi:FkbM family methyltransferase
MNVLDKGLKQQVKIARNATGLFCVPLFSMRQCNLHILNGRIFEPETINFVRDHAGSGDVVHAGTYFGDFLPGFASGLAAGAKLWAFEPVYESYLCARITVELNRLDQVELFHAGLGEETGDGVVVTHDERGAFLGEMAYVANRPAGGEDGGADDGQAIRILAIDDVVPEDRQVSILQLDVEGFETPALNGALKTIRRCRPILILELAPPEAWIAEHLAPLGYSIRGGVHANVIFSVKPVEGWGRGVRWKARQTLKALIPNPIRRKVRRWQSLRKPSAAPASSASAGLDCDILSTADGLRCMARDAAAVSEGDARRIERINGFLDSMAAAGQGARTA